MNAPYRETCYICRDPEFRLLGLPLCRKCPRCGGHVPADDTVCDDCGLDELEFHSEELARTELALINAELKDA